MTRKLAAACSQRTSDKAISHARKHTITACFPSIHGQLGPLGALAGERCDIPSSCSRTCGASAACPADQQRKALQAPSSQGQGQAGPSRARRCTYGVILLVTMHMVVDVHAAGCCWLAGRKGVCRQASVQDVAVVAALSLAGAGGSVTSTSLLRAYQWSMFSTCSVRAIVTLGRAGRGGGASRGCSEGGG